MNNYEKLSHFNKKILENKQKNLIFFLKKIILFYFLSNNRCKTHPIGLKFTSFVKLPGLLIVKLLYYLNS